jgi:uncharacterized small protein (DUF1192 family)
MAQQYTTSHYWNIFAFELKKILNQYGMGLGHLDDRIGIHREKVRRLIQSLQTPPSLPILNPEETQLIIETLQLTSEETLRLRAAVLTAAIQRMLSDRIHLDEARLAAEQILPTIIQALTEHANERGLGSAREGDIDPAEDSELNTVLDIALGAIDRGSEAMQLSYYTKSYAERVKKARQASSYYKDALADLESLSIAIRKQPVWQTWHNEAQQSLAQAGRRLEELGE